MRYLSVCSGIEAATVAWHPLGWEPLAFSEIEAFPRAVLAHHYPHVPVHGDFTKLRDEQWIADADLLVGGTPCQAFSVAGKRQSLADDRGNLTLEFVRLADAIDDLRRHDGRKPAIIVWENVPGVLSVKDNAFGCFLAALAGSDEPIVPSGGKWTRAGLVAGPERRCAWRVLDAQYFGVAQRRRRVFVVASARDDIHPAEVLFEREGVRRDTPPRRETGQGFAADVVSSLTASGRGVERTGETRGQDPVVAVPEIAGALDTQCGGGKLTHQSLTNGHVIGTITARMFAALGSRDVEEGALVPTYLDPLNQSTSEDIAKTLAARTDMDGMGCVTHALTRRYDSSEDGCGRGTPLVPMVYRTTAGAICRDSFAGGAGGRPEGAAANHFIAAQNLMAVRRLTPRECERLQGFHDDYTLIPVRGKPAADGPRYKALGNSMAVPVMAWIGKRIAKEVTR